MLLIWQYKGMAMALGKGHRVDKINLFFPRLVMKLKTKSHINLAICFQEIPILHKETNGLMDTEVITSRLLLDVIMNRESVTRAHQFMPK